MNPSLFVHDILTMNRDEVNTQMLKKNNCVSNVGSVQHFFSVGSVDNININNKGRRNPSLWNFLFNNIFFLWFEELQLETWK